MWRHDSVRASKGAGASQGFWEKVGLKPGCPEGPPSLEAGTTWSSAREKGAGGQRDDCRWDVFTEGR